MSFKPHKFLSFHYEHEKVISHFLFQLYSTRQVYFEPEREREKRRGREREKSREKETIVHLMVEYRWVRF